MSRSDRGGRAKRLAASSLFANHTQTAPPPLPFGHLPRASAGEKNPTVDPGFIASVRTKLALDQREAAEIFGGGVNAFSRYETGKTRPPLALVKLLRVLERHPELLGEVRAG